MDWKNWDWGLISFNFFAYLVKMIFYSFYEERDEYLSYEGWQKMSIERL